MKTLTVTGQLQQMASADVLRYVDSNAHARILLKDRHPEYRAYRIAYEGTAKGGRLINYGKTVLRWAKAAVQQLVDKLQPGTPFFHLHSTANDHAGRVPVGEVVGKALIDNDAVAIAYIPPAYRGINLDVASIEAEVQLTDATENNGVIDSSRFEILEVTGIALGDSAKDTPAFQHAGLIAQVALMAEPTTGDESMNIEEIRAAIAKLNCQPSDLFSPDTILSDPAVKSHNNNEFYARKRIEAEFKQEIDGLKAKITTLETEKQALSSKTGELSKKLAKGSAKDLLKTAIETRKLDDKQKAFVERKYSTFDPNDPEKIQEELNRFLDASLTEYDQFAEVFGVKKQEQKQGIGPDQNKEAGGDLSDPKNNELIPG